MSERHFNPTPHWTAALRAHLGILLRFRGIWVLPAGLVILYLWGAIVHVSMNTLNLSLPFGERIPLTPLSRLLIPGDPPVPIFAALAFAIGLPALLWALLVWQEERWGERDYMWSLPVDRPAHELTRAGAGAIWLFGFVLLYIAVGVSLALLAGQPLFPEQSLRLWATLFFYPLLTFLLFSIPALGSRTPLLWMAGVGVILAGAATLVEQNPEGILGATFRTFLVGGSAAAGLYEVVSIGLEQGESAWRALGRSGAGRVFLRHSTAEWFLIMLGWTTILSCGAFLAARRKL